MACSETGSMLCAWSNRPTLCVMHVQCWMRWTRKDPARPPGTLRIKGLQHESRSYITSTSIMQHNAYSLSCAAVQAHCPVTLQQTHHCSTTVHALCSTAQYDIAQPVLAVLAVQYRTAPTDGLVPCCTRRPCPLHVAPKKLS